MDKLLKQIKPMPCPVCDKFYFSKLSKFDMEELGLTPNTTQCDMCGWYYDLEQVADPDLKYQANEMSLNEYKAWYKKKIKKNRKWEYYQDFIGDPGPHPCPVCGEHQFPDFLSHDICPSCGWEDDNTDKQVWTNSNEPSEDFLEYKKWFEEQRKANPKYRWKADRNK